ncbi:MAG: hypothetical protein ACJ8DU_08760 [Microvirga sp.]|jgi:hypothetical protein
MTDSNVARFPISRHVKVASLAVEIIAKAKGEPLETVAPRALAKLVIRYRRQLEEIGMDRMMADKFSLELGDAVYDLLFPVRRTA